jgi:hypothetical protein
MHIKLKTGADIIHTDSSTHFPNSEASTSLPMICKRKYSKVILNGRVSLLKFAIAQTFLAL